MASRRAARVAGGAVIAMIGLAACGSRLPPSTATVPRYIVTASPIDINVGTAICVAVNQKDEHGVWWWEPGVAGCSTRSTGPEVFPASSATVVSSSNDASDVSFRIPIQSLTTPYVDVRLVVSEREIRVVNSGARVLAHVRRDLHLSETGPMRRSKAG
jgi:hypothetical protein